MINKKPSAAAKTYHSCKGLITEKSRIFVKKLFNEISELKHNEQQISQFLEIKEIRNIFGNSKYKAIAICIDWS